MKKTLRKFLIYLLATGMLMPTWLVTGMMSATHVKAADPEDIIITEYMVDPSAVSDANGEWIEVYNMTSTPIDLTGWSISDDSTAHLITAAEVGATIAANSYGLICKESDASINGNIIGCDYKASIELSNTGGAITLKDDSSTPKAIFIAGYYLSAVVAGKSIYFDGTTWNIENRVTYNGTDYGTPGADPFVPDISSAVVNDGLSADVDFTSSTNTLSANWDGFSDDNLDHYEYAIGTTIGGNDVKDWTSTSEKSLTESALTLIDGETYFISVKAIDEVGLESNVISSDGQMVDTIAPAVTGVTDSTIYDTDVTPIITDLNLDNTKVTLNGNLFTSGTAVSEEGSYVLVAADLAGNTTTINFTIKKVVPAVSPDFTVTVLDGKNFRVEWTGNGADSYIVKVNGNADPNGAVIANTTEQYSRDISVSEYGVYNITLIAVRGSVESTDFKNHSIELKAPVATTAQVTTPAPVEPAPVVSAAPAKAKAAAPQEEQKVETPADDSNGQIKGDETSNNEEEKVNWTPWIVLFVLILLAGAATGGYFYWFNGEDEVKAVVKEPKKEEKKVEALPKKNNNKKPNQKKQKRW